ncbi:MAG: SCO1664 family protein [Nocardioidaceae bacterium]|nr:SCO1664 family protein [Nocardioidaceae bacterium]
MSDAEVEEILTEGSLELTGRLVAASNASFLGEVRLDGAALPCIYKPVRGERPLWDFPDGTLASRERAARLVSEAASWRVVPPTVLRDGRFGPGMCQRWIPVDEERAYVDVVSADFDEPGWIAVLEAEDHRGSPVVLIHRDEDRLRDMAIFDAVINNADRKGGHVLVAHDDRLWGCDHGVSFHSDDKLRTVLWGWADDPLRPKDRASLEELTVALEGELGSVLATLLSPAEVRALVQRVERLRLTGRMPSPEGSWPAIPWPAF